MKKRFIQFALLFLLGLSGGEIQAQTTSNPAISSWIINTSGIKGKHYISGNSLAITDTFDANVQTVHYNTNYAYVSASGIPSYIIGPYLDNNPSQGSDNSNIYRIPLSPSENTGTKTATSGGTIGVFINGVSMYDYRDGASYSSSQNQNTRQGGDGVWNRDAILAEKDGFDCSKGHPSPIFGNGPPGPNNPPTGGNYHHHQNPSAFNLDLQVISTVCDLYASDGLYTIDSSEHSPLLGFSYDGFPVYGAYGYANSNGTGGVVRIESSYSLRNIAVRTNYADGSNVTDGPAVSATFPLGMYREDYEFIQGAGHLDEHNGRFSVTPEYPNGIYCYFATVDADWNSAYPYIIGPTYYGSVDGNSITSLPNNATPYNPTTSVEVLKKDIQITIYPNPATDFVAIQLNGLQMSTTDVRMYDLSGRLVMMNQIHPGSTLTYLDTRLLYPGDYILTIGSGTESISQKVQVHR